LAPDAWERLASASKGEAMKKSLIATGVATLLTLVGCGSQNTVAEAPPAEAQTVDAAVSNGEVFNQVVDNDALTRMFQWWNEAYQNPDGFTVEAFGQHFTKDAVLRINGKDRAKGLEDFTKHFRAIQERTDMVRINVPFLTAFSSPDGSKIFTYHTIDASEGGKPSHSMVMGYAELRDGKIALIDFLSIDGEPESAVAQQ
jgi:hypothetical protein